jgi:hypothetical protein
VQSREIKAGFFSPSLPKIKNCIDPYSHLIPWGNIRKQKIHHKPPNKPLFFLSRNALGPLKTKQCHKSSSNKSSKDSRANMLTPEESHCNTNEKTKLKLIRTNSTFQALQQGGSQNLHDL